MEDTVYGVTLDAALKTGLRARKAPEEIVEYQHIKDRIAIIMDHRKEEKNNGKEEAAGGGAAAATAGGNGAAATSQNDDGMAGSQTAEGGGDDTTALLSEEQTKAQEHLAYWKALAAKTLRSSVRLVAEPRTATGMKDIVADHAGQLGGRGYTVFFFDVKTSGEAVTAPHLRCAPLKEDQLQKLVRGCLTGRSGSDDDVVIRDKDLYVLLDGMKHGLALYCWGWVPRRRPPPSIL